MIGWRGAAEPVLPRIGALGWGLVALRGLAIAAVVYGGLVLLLVLRLAEAPLAGPRRPLTPHVTRAVCRAALGLIGLRLSVRGTPLRGRGAMVANHASWLDIFTLNACTTLYFVSKAEVARWPGIGWLARATGTVFIARDRREAKDQQRLFEDRIRAGHRMLFFPEGTSTDGLRVLPFKPTLFAAYYTHGLEHVMQIQPVSVIYHAPAGRAPSFYGWWGEMVFGRHFLAVLAQPRQGSVEVVFHDPLPVDASPSRKDLAARCAATVRQGVRDGLGALYRG